MADFKGAEAFAGLDRGLADVPAAIHGFVLWESNGIGAGGTNGVLFCA